MLSYISFLIQWDTIDICFLNLHTHIYHLKNTLQYPFAYFYIVMNVEFFSNNFFCSCEDNFVIYFNWAINMLNTISRFPSIKSVLH